MLDVSPWYEGREQSYIKHFVLSRYLDRFARIIGSRWSSITYVDSFAGPWESKHPELADTSFYVALEALRDARQWFRERGKELRIRCMFLEADVKRYPQLKEFAERQTDVEVKTRNRKFETAVPAVLEFIRSDPDTFPFLFIDPTGWTGFPLDTMRPLLELNPGEVLINFMTHHIRRFANLDAVSKGLSDMYGRDIREDLADLKGLEREERTLGEYMRAIRKAGHFLYIGSAIILKPEIDTTHFHLVYATRHNKGVAAFKEVEQEMTGLSIGVRASAKERARLARTGQATFLAPEALHPPQGTLDLREQYVSRARAKIRTKLEKDRRVPYGLLWRMALAFPLVWEQDIKAWIAEWQSAGYVTIPTLAGGRRRVPNPDLDEIEWIAG